MLRLRRELDGLLLGSGATRKTVTCAAHLADRGADPQGLVLRTRGGEPLRRVGALVLNRTLAGERAARPEFVAGP